jgi:hypothetical protein
VSHLDGERLELNRKSWDFANSRFNRRKGDYASAIRSGAIPPLPIVKLLGLAENMTVLHLMCNDGREAAMLSHHTGASFHGVDFSIDAIVFARRLNDELGLSNTFEPTELHTFLSRPASRQFDLVLLTPGSVRWLPDLTYFFSRLGNWLSAEGEVCIWDIHPLPTCLDEHGTVVRNYPIRPTSYQRTDGVRDYVGQNDDFALLNRSPDQSLHFLNPLPVWFSEYSYSHVIEAAVRSGEFQLRSFKEFSFSWEEKLVPWLTVNAGGIYSVPSPWPEVPLTYWLRFAKARASAGVSS